MVRAVLLVLVLCVPVLGQAKRYCEECNGDTGIPGRDGQDADSRSTKAFVGGDILWHEWDNHVGVKSGYRFDTLRGGHSVDMAVIQWRVGKSPEDRELDKLRVKIKELEQRWVAPESVPVAQNPRKQIILNGQR